MDFSFDCWVRWVFDRPVKRRRWYLERFEDPWAEDPRMFLAYLRRLFERPQFLPSTYSRDQVGQGLWFLGDGTASGYMECLFDHAIPFNLRDDAIASIPQLFRYLFANQCGDALGHLDREGNDALNMTCYMWWDIFPTKGGNERAETLFDTMSKILVVDSEACKESALHGLGHAAEKFPDRVKAIIDEFLTRRPKISEQLKQYALRAREGEIL